ncbi:MAG: hypothetical protein DMF82_16210 [Acidobacteria bacterium]|nr:MAG: hypothetical protein DMF82_16210 [Acidobacteriota bacterium]
MRLSRLVLAVASAAALAGLAFAVARRIAYPYDLEWMEGGMLCHALRVVQREPIYAEPSARFVSFAYTPLYPILLGLLAPVAGVGYVPARAVSVAAFAGALIVAYAFVRHAGGSRAAAFGTAALPAAAFAPTGAWYDLARIDSLFLGLTAAAVAVGWWRRNGPAGPVAAGVLITAAFFTKQTALPFAGALGLALLLARPRAAVLYAATVAMLGGALLAWAHLASGGWFWTYAFGLHRRHPFDALDAVVVTPARLFLLLGPGLVLLGLALRRTRAPDLLYATGMALTGLVASALGAGTEWSYHNALIPGVYFTALAVGTATAAVEPWQPVVASLLLAAAVGCAPGGLLALAARALPRAGLALPLGYDPRAFLPSAADRERGDALVARLAASPGDVFVPDHSFYPHLAGKPTSLHAMNIADLQGAGLRVPKDLVEQMRQKRFSLVVVDREETDEEARDPAVRAREEEEAIGLVPGLTKNYRLAERIVPEGPRVYSGGRFVPCCVLVPRDGLSDPLR